MLEILENTSELFELWKIIGNPQRVFGWLLHEMWKMTTSKGIFAVKILNSEIMKRPEAYGNFVLSEKIANLAKDAGIPAMPALRVDKNSLIQIWNRYVMVFPWIDWGTLSEAPAWVNASHAIGRIIGQIHNLWIKDDAKDSYSKMTIDAKYLATLESEFSGISEKILELQRKYNDSLPILNSYSILSHWDIDQKNVLWKNNNPIIIR